MIHFDSDGTPQLQSNEWASFLNRILQSFDEFFNITGHAQTDIQDHSMEGYQQLVQSKADALDQLFQTNIQHK